jgi:hypothetical protein
LLAYFFEWVSNMCARYFKGFYAAALGGCLLFFRRPQEKAGRLKAKGKV